MNCEKRQQQILLKQSGELSARQLARLNRHIASCDECQAFEQSLNVIHQAATPKDADLAITDFTRHRILQEAASHCEQNGKQVRHMIQLPRHAIIYAPALAALLLAVIGLPLFFNHRPPQPTASITQQTPTGTEQNGIWEDNWDEELDELQESVLLMSQTLETSTSESENTTTYYSTDDLAKELLAMEES